MSSIAGSMSTGLAFGKSLAAAYSPTKAAATMLALHYHFDLKPEGFVVKPLHPGWVKTEMGGPAAMMEIKDSIDGL
jgi:NAD(P)-dependent dehydrogenase (short-subunit alcohol dehydrogenase family)